MILHIILIVVLVRLEYTLHLQEYPTCILCVLAAFGFHQAHMHSQLHHFPSKFIISYFVTYFNTRSQKNKSTNITVEFCAMYLFNISTFRYKSHIIRYKSHIIRYKSHIRASDTLFK